VTSSPQRPTNDTLLALLRGQQSEPIQIALRSDEQWHQLRSYEAGVQNDGYQLQVLSKRQGNTFSFLATLVRPDGGIVYQEQDKGEGAEWLDERSAMLVQTLASVNLTDPASERVHTF
jgi:hypothetical protein